MLAKFRTAILAALVGLGTTMFMPAGAQADGIYFSFGSGPRAHSHFGHPHRHYRPRPSRVRACTPPLALHKARRMGLHHPRIVRVNGRIIRVAGHRYRHRASVVFARAPHCPVIRAT